MRKRHRRTELIFLGIPSAVAMMSCAKGDGVVRNRVEMSTHACSGRTPVTCTILANHPTAYVYRIDRNVVTVSEYERCVKHARCPPLMYRISDDPDEVARTQYDGAQSFCRSRAGRLPTGTEWELASRGSTMRLYPWGNTWNAENWIQPRYMRRSDHIYAGYAAAGTRPDVRSELGLEDLTGTGPEFVATDNEVQTRGCGYILPPRSSPEIECSLARTRTVARTNAAAFRCVYPAGHR
jgi:formylglycine-generating enzyme required for sulfatase activity